MTQAQVVGVDNVQEVCARSTRILYLQYCALRMMYDVRAHSKPASSWCVYVLLLDSKLLRSTGKDLVRRKKCYNITLCIIPQWLQLH